MITELRAAGFSNPAARHHRRARGIALALGITLILGGGVVVVRTQIEGSPPPMAIPRGVRAVTGISALQHRLERVPRDWNSWAALGSAYVQEARITGDPSYYPKAENALRRSLHLDSDSNHQALVGMGALSAARHDFTGALRWSRRARAVDPYSSAVYGVMGDALVELGRYPEAFRAFQKMVDLEPGLASYSRASYAWELQGDIPHAIEAMKLAVRAASTKSDAAFATYYLGELYWNSGQLAAAEAQYALAVAHDPTFVPGTQGLAKVEAAEGNVSEALETYGSVVDRLPLPQFVIEYGDLASAAGRVDLAKSQYELVRIQERLFRSNGVDLDLEQAIFAADHNVSVRRGLVAAQHEWARRKSVFVADALAWSLYASGRYDEALTYAGKALRLGTKNASFHFHKGMIERALGLRAAARDDLSAALRLNPQFSVLWAPKAAVALEELR